MAAQSTQETGSKATSRTQIGEATHDAEASCARGKLYTSAQALPIREISAGPRRSLANTNCH
jgi:hypothetical protein